MPITKEKERELARLLYMQGITPGVIAERMDVSERTVQRWADKYNWDTFRKSLLATKDNQIRMMYDSLDAINRAVTGREESKNYHSPGEVDTVSKLTASIQRLETETGLGEVVSVLMKFGNHVAQHAPADHKRLVELMDGFIQSQA